MKCLEKHQSFRFQKIDDVIVRLDFINGNIVQGKDENEIIDSPTIVIPPITDLDDEVINIDLIDKNADNAFRTFFQGEEEPKDKKEKNKNQNNKKITIAAILSAFVIALIGGIAVFKALLYVPEVTVPDLLGRKEEEARKIIEDLGLEFKVANRDYSDEYEEGRVIKQNVNEGTKVKEGYPIEVIISKGQKEIIVPNLIGKYAIEAGIILKDAGLKEGEVKEENSDKVPAGRIIDQFPAANTTASKNDAVSYVVSLGPKVVYVKMPNLLNLSLDEAKLSIVQNGLTVGKISEEYSDEIQEGLVMRQSIVPGQDVEQGTSVWLTVSLGKNEEEQQSPEEPAPEPGEGNFPLTIALPTDREKVTLVIQRIAQEGREVIFSKEVDTSEQSIIINLKGSGTEVYEIYIDNEYYDRVEITF